MEERDEIFPELLDALSRPGGVKWEDAKTLLADVTRRRQDQAAVISKRLLGKPKTWRECPDCFGWGKAKGKTCMTCLGNGRMDVY